jgi:hypothetical protein
MNGYGGEGVAQFGKWLMLAETLNNNGNRDVSILNQS